MRLAVFLLGSLALAAADRDPARILQRTAIKVRVGAATLPNYTCVETVNRDYYRTKGARLDQSCPAILAERQGRDENTALRLVLTDRLRLDVTLTGQGEIYSWAGASRFEDSRLDQLVRRGPIATGSFGALLDIVFGQDPKTFHFERSTVLDGRSVMEYSFQTPKEESHYKVKTADSWVYTAYSGRVEVDAETYDVVRLMLQTAELPPATGTCQTGLTMDFSRVRIGDGDFLLPKQGRQRFVSLDGEEVDNSTSFAGCREYRGESTISFFPPPETGDRESVSQPTPLKLPAGMPFTFELTKAISAGNAAGGDLFTGRLVNALRDKDRKVWAPARAVVEGRLLRVECRRIAPLTALLVLRLHTIEIGGVKVALTADRDTRKPAGGRAARMPVLLPLSWEQHAGLFLLAGDHAVMKAGSRSDWLTADGDTPPPR